MMNRTIMNCFVILLLTALLTACGEAPKSGNPANMPVPVNVYVAQLQPVSYYEEYPANVVALNQVDLRAQVEGYITGIFFKEGDKVRKGQKLYDIDRSKYEASYNQALANVKVAEANDAQAQKDADRYIYLNQHDAVAKQILDHALTTRQNAQNQLNAARQELKRAQTDLGFSVIKAPFDGTIGLSQVKLGTLVTAGQTLLNTISTTDPMAVDFVINEKEIGKYIQLQQQKNNPKDSMFTILTPDNALYDYPGVISVIDRGVDPQTGTIKIRLTFPNSHLALRAGMSCKVRVHNADTSAQILIPAKAIVEQMGEYFVYVTKDTVIKAAEPGAKDALPAGPALAASQRKVITGKTINANVVVKSGLEAGDHVIVDGVQKLHEGSVVTTTKPADTKAKK